MGIWRTNTSVLFRGPNWAKMCCLLKLAEAGSPTIVTGMLYGQQAPSFGWDVKPRSWLRAHTLDLLYDSLSSPPVAGVWWEHTLDCLYDSLPSPPVAGVWWEHTLDCLYISLLSTCSWCVVSAYTWLALWFSLLSTCSWCVVSAYTWLALWLSLSSPPVAGVWWEHTLDWLYDSLSPLDL